MKTIYNTYVEMESQEQCDRMKQLCIDNKLRIWDSFNYVMSEVKYKYFYIDLGDFCNWLENSNNFDKVTEQEFIELLKKTKI